MCGTAKNGVLCPPGTGLGLPHSWQEHGRPAAFGHQHNATRGQKIYAPAKEIWFHFFAFAKCCSSNTPTLKIRPISFFCFSANNAHHAAAPHLEEWTMHDQSFSSSTDEEMGILWGSWNEAFRKSASMFLQNQQIRRILGFLIASQTLLSLFYCCCWERKQCEQEEEEA